MASLAKIQLKRGLDELERLAQADYSETISTVVNSADNPDIKLPRIGRLIGISMKEPFSQSRARTRQTRDSRSRRAWTLRPETLLNDKAVRTTWQYESLRAMANEAKLAPSVMAERLRRERNFFGSIFISVHKYVCGNAKIRGKVIKNVEAARKSGMNIRIQDPEVIVGAGGVALGSYLVTVVPILGFVGAPVIAGLVLVLYTIGLDAFCDWASASEKPKPKFPPPRLS